MTKSGHMFEKQLALIKKKNFVLNACDNLETNKKWCISQLEAYIECVTKIAISRYDYYNYSHLLLVHKILDPFWNIIGTRWMFDMSVFIIFSQIHNIQINN